MIPAERTLRDLGRAIWPEAERGLLATIQMTVNDAELMRADAVLSTQHGTSAMTVLEWLKTRPARHSPATITETLSKVRFLKSLGAHTRNLNQVPIEKQRAYAQRIQARRPAKVREFKASTRTIELIFLLHVTLLELTDALLYQTGHRVSDLVRHATNARQSNRCDPLSSTANA
ncbi:hypothetical protein WT83_14145 [Burkholderia territorii]|uniref:Uncharacterized protein n=1 Tax=Burkholderia territorii TaxID=1503055 RepID=A0A108ET42_9BURK|nr:hypothetical protein [Burkholderia territorii]KWN16841.1 hypothetical protein WT83_14145 [Burkholderia territorii]